MAASSVFCVLTKLADPIIEEAKRVYGVSDDVDWLASEMRWMQCFLKDAETKLKRDRSNLINNWVRDVREVAQETEDIIDNFMLTIEPRQRRQRRTGGLKGCILRYVCLPFELKPRHEVGAEIQQLRAKIQLIKTCKDTYGLENLCMTSAARPIDEALHERRRITPHLHNEDTVLIGFDAHKKAIIGQLLDADIKQRCVVSIVGTGGIGKTTLATKIYNNSQIKIGFHAHACVSVSQTPRYDDMLRRIAKDVLGTSTKQLQSMEIDDVESELYQFLNEKKYLIVLDDVWSPNVWSGMSKFLPDVKNGSRILVTTRSMEVAKSSCTCIKPYELPLLDNKQSWDLFLRNAFFQNEDANLLCCPEVLEDVGGKLVKKCGGLPLALVALGGLVSRKDPTHAEWARVANRMDWTSTEDGQNCINILALSYDDLPHHHLKFCFLYLAVYPEDHEFHESKVVNLWIAEGLIATDARTRTVEETAKSYLHELVGRSMIQPIYSPWYPSLSYRIHDLFRDFCINEAKNDGFLSVYCRNSIPREMRHNHNPCSRVALHDLSSNEVNNWCPAPNSRSLLAFGTEFGNGEILNGLKLVRVIHLESGFKKSGGFSNLPKQLLESSIHLRYLCMIEYWKLREFPSSIGGLCNLQTLDLSGTQLKSLPGSIGKMQMLRHLYLPIGGTCECPPDICNLKNLRTLDGAGGGGGWIEHRSEKLVNMERLVVRELSDRAGDVLLHSVGKMKGLTYLHLKFYESITAADSFLCFSNLHQLLWMFLVGPIPEVVHLVFPPNLTTLKLATSWLKQDPMAVLEKLPNLTALYLDAAYTGAGMICTAGGFPSLQQLIVLGLNELEEWTVEYGAMPKFNLLLINRCGKLVMLPEGLQHLTSLKRLEVYDLREEFRQRLEPEVGEDWHKIRHVPTIIIHSEFERFPTKKNNP